MPSLKATHCLGTLPSLNKKAKFAPKFFEMAKGKDKKKAGGKAKPVAKKAAKPAAKKVAKPAAKKAAKPVAKAKKVAPKAKAKPVAKKVAKPAKKVSKPVAKKVAKAKPVAKKVVKKAAKPAVKKAAKPVAKKVTAKKAAKPTPKPLKKAKAVVAKKEKPAKKVKVVAKKEKPAKKVKEVAKPVAKKEEVKVAAPRVEFTPRPGAKKSALRPFVTGKSRRGRKPKPRPEPKPVRVPEVLPTITRTAPPPMLTKPQPKVAISTSNKARYSDNELKEFKTLIDKKLEQAREELKNLKDSLANHTDSQAGNKAWNLEEGTDTSEMEYLMNQISRQHQYIRNLELALIRVDNKTYGICRVTGKLIPKERLRVVPHATLSLEAKMSRKPEDNAPEPELAKVPAEFTENFSEE